MHIVIQVIPTPSLFIPSHLPPRSPPSKSPSHYHIFCFCGPLSLTRAWGWSFLWEHGQLVSGFHYSRQWLSCSIPITGPVAIKGHTFVCTSALIQNTIKFCFSERVVYHRFHMVLPNSWGTFSGMVICGNKVQM